MDRADLLQIKIEQAKAKLSPETLSAINAVNWKAVIAAMIGKGFTIEQLWDLELETELLLCGLVPPESYPKELERRMDISGSEVSKLVKEMDEKVFKKIKEKLIESTTRKDAVPGANPPEPKLNDAELKKAGIEIMGSAPAASSNGNHVESREEILKRLGQPELEAPARNASGIVDAGGPHPILAQRLSGPVQSQPTKTEHTLENISKTAVPPPLPSKKYDVDPYREIPE